MSGLHWAASGDRDGRAAVLLLHGLGSSSQDWERQVPALAARRRVLAVDLPGHGRSPRPRRHLTVEAMADDVARALDAAGAAAAHAVGLSLGGCVALALALRHPARVRSLTLVNAFARFEVASPRAVRRSLARLALLLFAPMSVVAQHVARGLFPRPEQAVDRAAVAARLARAPRGAYISAMCAGARWDARSRLREIRCPALVVVGEDDATVSRRSAERLHAGIHGARYLLVPGAGHVTVWERAEVFNRALLEFLDEAEAHPPR